MKKREKKLGLHRETVLALDETKSAWGGDYTGGMSVNTKCHCTDTTDPVIV